MFILKHRKNGINCLAFSPDGTLLAASGYRGYIQMWDLATKELRHEIQEGNSDIETIVFLPENRLLAVAASVIRLFDVGTGKRLPTGLRMDGLIRVLAPGPWPVNQIFIDYWDRTSIYCYDWPDGKKRWRAPRFPVLGNTMAMAAGTDRVLLGMNVGHIVSLDARTGDLLEQFCDGVQQIRCVALSPNERSVAWCAATHLRLRHLDLPNVVKHVNLGKTHFLSVAWHPSGTFYATANGDGTVDYWDGTTGERRESFAWEVGKLHDVVFDTNGDRAACSSKTGEIVVWDVDT